MDDTVSMETDSSMEVGMAESLVEVTCMPERAALIKSILNFLKKAIPEPTFAENLRNCESFRNLFSLILLSSLLCFF